MAVTRTDSGAPQAALLIDADNLSPLGMEQAVGELHRLGLSLSILRAYGSLETLASAKSVLQRHGGRGLSNNGPGTTDAALVVDAMDMLHAGQLPATVAIGSSDGDFAPLAVRLRESGRRVLCFAHGHKAAVTELQRVYAEVVLLADGAAAPAVPGRSAPAPRKTSSRSAAKTAAKTATPRRGAAEPARRPAAKDSAADAVLAVLDALPGFRKGHVLALNDVVKKLRDEKLMGKNAGASSFFKKLALPVELMPATQPNQIRRLSGAGA